MRHCFLILTGLTILACTPTDYQWHYKYDPSSGNYEQDLETCRSYASKQYQSGMPEGSHYLDDYPVYPDGYDHTQLESGVNSKNSTTWHPDRNPNHLTNLNQQPFHDVPKNYTGYPGYLDYYPNYLDEILEKCMSDRGWVYRPQNKDFSESN